MRMFKKIFTTSLAALVLLGASLGLMHRPAYALFENAKGEAQCGVNLQDGATGADGTCVDNTNSESKLNNTLSSVLDILSLVAGIIAVIMLIIAGVRFITSQGDSGSTASARNTVIYAIVGIVIVVIAQAIVFFVVGKTGEVTSTNPSGSSVVTSPDGKTTTTTSKDGTRVVVVTNDDGTKTTTTYSPDGSIKVCKTGEACTTRK